MSEFKILSFNIHKGFHFFLRKYNLEKLKGSLLESGADIVFLQEVLGFHPEKYKNTHKLENQFEYLADQTWTHFVYGKNAIYHAGDHGNAILSKYPFSFYLNYDLSTNPFEKRSILHGTVNIEQVKIHLMCVHLNLTEKGRQKQIKEIATYINEKIPYNEPFILAGDFNDWQLKGERLLCELVDIKSAHYSPKGKILRTFPAHLPILSLDRVYYRHLDLTHSMTLKPSSKDVSSDHLPILSTFRLGQQR